MSIFIPVKARCTSCDTEVETDLAASVNADRRPDLRQAILDCTFQSMSCPGCGKPVRLPAHLTYIDMARGQWILVEDAPDIVRWGEIEAEAQGLYSKAFGREAPPLQRAMGKDITARLVFGWTALREKLIAQEAGLDDTVLELMKMSVMRNVDGPPVGDLVELRLIDFEDGQMTLRWIDGGTEEGIADLTLDREIYDDIAANLAPWEELRKEVSAGLFVDMKRLFVGAGPAEAAGVAA